MLSTRSHWCQTDIPQIGIVVVNKYIKIIIINVLTVVCWGGDRGNAELHAHHKVPLSEGGGNEYKNLTTLCKNCHNEVHGQSVGGSRNTSSTVTPPVDPETAPKPHSEYEKKIQNSKYETIYSMSAIRSLWGSFDLLERITSIIEFFIMLILCYAGVAISLSVCAALFEEVFGWTSYAAAHVLSVLIISFSLYIEEKRLV